MQIDQFSTSPITDFFLADFRRLHDVAMKLAASAGRHDLQAQAAYCAARERAIEAGAKFAEAIATDLQEHGA